MDIQIAVSKINKQVALESGDTLEAIERPSGGISVVLSDGRGSGYEHKKISSLVVQKVLALICEGTRDGMAAKAASDFLFESFNGTKTAYLSILSVDLQTQTITITSNNPVPVFISQKDQVDCIGGQAVPIGSKPNITPAITQLPLEEGITVIIYTDGIANAGSNQGIPVDVCTLLESLLEDQDPSAQSIADTILAEAMRLDQAQPQDDMSIVVLRIVGGNRDRVRRMVICMPVIDDQT
ncbi:MAG: SpoIIE family protein phosphatase [Anaerolineaceae bacterium]|nr:SpoIIE family protein phosphatase [Anaerolineaceae bacterium]